MNRSFVQVLHAAAHDAARFLDRARALQGLQEIERLAGGENFDREDPRDVVDDRRELAGGDRRHRDVVLLGGSRRDRVDRSGMRKDLALGHERRRRHLREHEARLQAAVLGQEPREVPESEGLTSFSIRRSEIDARSVRTIAARSSGAATGAP